MDHDEPPTLTTAELRLRLPADGDVEAVTRACQDPEIVRWTRVPSPYTAEHARWWVRQAQDAFSDGEGLHLVVVDADERLLGSVGLQVDPRDHSGELGYWLVPAARGRGVATQAARALLREGLARYGLGYIQLWAAAANPPSNAVARRLGFTLEGRCRDAMLLGASGDRTAPRGEALLWGLRPGELT